jgi:hypothetical protein
LYLQISQLSVGLLRVMVFRLARPGLGGNQNRPFGFRYLETGQNFYGRPLPDLLGIQSRLQEISLEPDRSALDAFLALFHLSASDSKFHRDCLKALVLSTFMWKTPQSLHCEQSPQDLLLWLGSFVKHVNSSRWGANGPSSPQQLDPWIPQGSTNILHSTTFLQDAGQTTFTALLDHLPHHHHHCHCDDNGSPYHDAPIATAYYRHGEGIMWRSAQAMVMTTGLKGDSD